MVRWNIAVTLINTSEDKTEGARVKDQCELAGVCGSGGAAFVGCE